MPEGPCVRTITEHEGPVLVSVGQGEWRGRICCDVYLYITHYIYHWSAMVYYLTNEITCFDHVTVSDSAQS